MDFVNRLRMMLVENGFSIRVYKVPHDDLWKEPGRYDLVALPRSTRADRLSPVLHSKGSQNLQGYHNPRVDALLDALDRAESPEAEARLDRELHAVLVDDLPLLYLWRLDTLAVWKGIENVTLTPRDHYGTFDSWSESAD